MTAKELRVARAKLITDARVLLDASDATAESLARANTMLDESDAMLGRIGNIERADALEAGLAEQRQNVTDRGGPSVDRQVSDLDREKRIMTALLRGDHKGLNDADRQEFVNRLQRVSNAAGTGTSPGGGYTIAPAFQKDLLQRMVAFGGMRQAAQTIETDTGVNLPWPTLDDTANMGSILAENSQVGNDNDLVFGQVSMGAWTYKSGLLLVSLQILQDSAFDFDKLVRNAMATRLARIQNLHFTTGTGVGQPQGVVTGAAQGVVGANGSTTSVTFDNCIDLIHSVDPAYRSGAKFMAHDTTLQALRKLKDNTGRYLWQPYDTGIAGAPPGDSIWGYPLVINQQMPVMAASAKSIVFGDFSNYMIRDVLGMQMMVLRERYADFLQVGYIAFMRTDGRIISAAQPLKYYQNSAT